MKESTTYRAILEEGRIEGILEGEKKTLLLLGTRRFGPPEATALEVIEGLDSVGKLDQLTARLLDVSSWDELLSSA